MSEFETKIQNVSADHFQESDLAEALKWLEQGEVVAFPTETVYGLGALGETGAEKLCHLKGRDPSKPFTWHVSDPEVVERFVPHIPPLAERVMKHYWPGPITIVIPHPEGNTFGFRLPAHNAVRELIRRAGGAILGTSANPSGEPPATDAEAVWKEYRGKIPLILDSGPTPLQEASTVVYIGPDSWRILREGIVSKSMLEKLAGGLFLFVCTGNTCRSPLAAALFRQKLAETLEIPEGELEEQGFQVVSAGLFASEGSPASDHSQTVAEELGVHLKAHRSQPLTLELVQKAHHIFVMTEDHLRALLHTYPHAKPKVHLLHPEGIPDPFGGSVATYRKTAEQILDGIQATLEELYPFRKGKKSS